MNLQYSAPLITAQELSYASNEKNTPLFSGVNFSLAQGEILCLAGPNGSGKTTLLYTLCGLLKPTSGILKHYSSNKQFTRTNHPLLVLHDAAAQIFGNTPKEDVLLNISRKEPAYTEYLAMAEQLASILQIASIWNDPIHCLSHGQQRKVCLTAALVRKPSILLLDEPLNGLDFSAICELRHIMMACKTAGMGLVISTHDLEPFIDLCDNILFLHATKHFFGPMNESVGYAAQYGVRPPGTAWSDFNEQAPMQQQLTDLIKKFLRPDKTCIT